MRDGGRHILTDSRSGALGMSFEYDVEGRLSKAYQTNAPSQCAVYAYDAQDRLASRTATSGATTTTTLYVHDLNDHIIAETNVSGQTLREYLWLNDLPIAVVDGVNTASPTLYYVHTDHLGRPARMVAQSWAWVWDVIYSPFGAVSAIFDSTTKLDMRFPGQWFQMESGLAYNWHRHYDATLGRYVQPDPIGYGGGRNLYGYVGQNPLAHVDPDGQNPILVIIGFCEEFPWACSFIAKETGAWVLEQISNSKLENDNCSENDNSNCSKASSYQLRQARIDDPHSYKTEYGAIPNSKFDICACKDGRIIIKDVGNCGKPGPAIETFERWK